MNPLEILDTLYESVVETGKLYVEVHKDESMSDEVRMQALDKVAKCANLCARISMKKNEITSIDTTKFPAGGIISHDFGAEGGEFVIKKP